MARSSSLAWVFCILDSSLCEVVWCGVVAADTAIPSDRSNIGHVKSPMEHGNNETDLLTSASTRLEKPSKGPKDRHWPVITAFGLSRPDRQSLGKASNGARGNDWEVSRIQSAQPRALSAEEHERVSILDTAASISSSVGCYGGMCQGCRAGPPAALNVIFRPPSSDLPKTSNPRKQETRMSVNREVNSDMGRS